MINRMPEIDLTKCNLNETEMMIAKIAIKGEKEIGYLRASKPAEQKHTIIDSEWTPSYASELSQPYKHHKNKYATEEERIKAFGCYVWRELAFIMSPISTHHCMPVCNDFNLEYTSGDPRRKEQHKWLNSIVDRISKTVPVHQLHGLRRWKGVFGY